MLFDFNLGSRLREFRKKANLSTTKLSEITGISSGYISELENGKKSDPSFEIIYRLLRGINVSVDSFMNDTPVVPLSPESKELVDIFNSLSSSKRKALLSVAHVFKNM
ncbi:helix-turn-helix domain-containing protein [Ruminiclostridium cellobioparum]|uniref:helix-turn-helix domain-containing protein n=1 Tax=Ruminiclostridium cellobioparum TaxID=29355 RepID=UPI0028B2515D|nr:helix-turn-helix transcriptional regulator [Ruminiclostridium cellobioparum]